MTSASPSALPSAAGDEVFVLPASSAQQRIWVLDQLDPGRATHNVPFNLRLRGKLDRQALAASLTWLVERHEPLRTVFDARNGEIMQVVFPPSAVELPIRDLRLAGEVERARALDRLVEDAAMLPFDLATDRMLRAVLVHLSDDEYSLLLTSHHIAIDGWSLSILQRELSVAYAAFATGSSPALPPLEIQYGDYASWEQERILSGKLDAQVSYWKEQLTGLLPSLDVPTDHARTAERHRQAQAISFQVDAETTQLLARLGRESGATLYVTLLAAYQLLLHRYSGQDDIIVGSPVAGRTRRETEGLIGLFVNSLAIRTNVVGSVGFRALLAPVRQAVLGALANQDLPFERVVEAVHAERDRARSPLFQTLFSLQDFTSRAPVAMPGVSVSRLSGARSTAKFELQLMMMEHADGLRGSLEYDSSLFEEATVRSMMRHFVVLLREVAAAPDRPVDELPMIDAAERDALLNASRGVTLTYDGATIHGLVSAQIARTPDAIALVHDGTRVTYGELGTRVSRLAAVLRTHAVGPEVCVGVCLPRSPDLVVALLAILEAGGAYVPLDPAYPAARNDFVLGDSGAVAVVTDRTFAGKLSLPAILVDTPAPSDQGASRGVDVRSTNLAYLIYTSGSTGKPKGVAIEHRSVAALIAWAREAFTPQELAGVLFSTSVCFDLSVFEMFVPLSCGGSVVIAENVLALPTLRDADLVTLVNTVPSAMTSLLRVAQLPRSVQTVNLAGEPLATSLVARLYGLPHVTRVYDLYGPSEDTTYSTWALRHPHEPPTIGRPIANTQAYVLDDYRQPVPAGVAGELYLGGDGVARGYHGRPELTGERFLPDTFTNAPGARMYRTGDQVRRRATGRLEFIGRLDHQVKIRGFRIEPGEVQACLEQLAGIREGAVVVGGEALGEKRLLGYYVLADGSSLTPEAVRAELHRRLPDHLVPAHLMALGALPRTPNGKLDRNALPDANEALAASVPPAPPRTLIEHELALIWRALLPGTEFGLCDSFFDIGGHSLLAVQMVFEIERVRGRRVPLSLLFEKATIEELAAWLTSEVRAEVEPPVVILQASGTQPPIAFVHGDARGGGWYCRRLAPLAAPDSPFYLLPTIGKDAEVEPLTIESMAAVHLAELRKVQSRGPYRLAGFCTGGLIAFEMARRLRAAGEEVHRLIIVDAAAINVRVRALRPLLAFVPGRDANVKLSRQAVIMRRARRYVSSIWRVSRRGAAEQFDWVVSNMKRRVSRALAGPLVGSPAPRARSRIALDPNTQELATALRTDIAAGPGATVLLMHARASSLYIPKRFDGTIDLIWAHEDPGPVVRSTRGWSHFATDVRVHPVMSTHLGMVTSELPQFAEAFRRALDGVDG